MVINNSFENYPELKQKSSYIKKIIKLEEERFDETIDSGMSILDSYMKDIEDKKKKILSGKKSI